MNLDAFKRSFTRMSYRLFWIWLGLGFVLKKVYWITFSPYCILAMQTNPLSKKLFSGYLRKFLTMWTVFMVRGVWLSSFSIIDLYSPDTSRLLPFKCIFLVNLSLVYGVMNSLVWVMVWRLGLQLVLRMSWSVYSRLPH